MGVPGENMKLCPPVEVLYWVYS